MGAKNRADITPEIRGGLKRCLKIMEDRGEPISTVWDNLFTSDPATAMRLAISLLPKEHNIDSTISHDMNTNTNQFTEDFMLEIVEKARERRATH